MKKILAFAVVLSALSLVACGDEDSKNEACVTKFKGANALCFEVAGQDFSDTDCSGGAAANDSLAYAAASSCPSGSSVKCDLKDSTSGKTMTYAGYGDTTSMGYAMGMMACHPELLFKDLTDDDSEELSE